MSEFFKYKNYHGSVKLALEDDLIVGKVEYIKDLILFEGKSIEEARQDFRNAIDDYIEMCSEIRKEPEKPYSGTFNIRIGQELHRNLAILAGKNDTSINEIIKIAVTRYLEQQDESMLQSHIVFVGHIPGYQDSGFTTKERYSKEVYPWVNPRSLQI